MSRLERLATLGLSEEAATAQAVLLDRARAVFGRTIATSAERSYFVPGRIEVLGKHTDYAGGRSLLCAVERGIALVAQPRPDRVLTVANIDTGETITVDLAPDAAVPANHWSLYPATVARRLARDFPDARGADVAVASNLPIAAGLSSSSALITAVFVALSDRNRLDERPDYAAAIRSPEDLAGYLGAVENGLAFGPFPGDRGVGTAGGSEDHTAILWCRAGQLSQYAFLPVRFEDAVPLPAAYAFAVGASGIVAEKTGPALEHYNALSRTAQALADLWHAATGRRETTLGAILASAPDAADRLADIVRRDGPGAGAMLARLRQFRAECEEIIPDVVAALAAGDVTTLGALVDRSQALAVDALCNQIPETVALQRDARTLGAAAASAFGAGFGGSVWALVRRVDAAAFVEAWAARYRRAFPRAASRAEFFVTPAGPGLLRL